MKLKNKILCVIIMLLNLKNLKAQERGKRLFVKKGSAASAESAAQNSEDLELQQALAASMNPSSNVNPADYDPDLALILAASMNPSSNVNPADYDPDLASALAASLLPAAKTAQNSAAQNSEDLELQRDLADIARSEAADAQVEPDFEARAEQGEFVQEKSEPETITVKGKQYTIHQLQTIGQSKVTGRCDGDMSCFGQSVKNAAAIIDWQQTRDDSALATLVRLPEARAKLKEITRLLDDTDFPLGSRTHAQLKDENGFYHDVDVEQGSALFEQHQSRNPFLHYQIVMNRNFLDNLRLGTTDIQEGLQMLQEDSSRFFELYQLSSSTLDAINAWRSGNINILGIVLQTEGHYIAIVFERNSDSGETNIWVSDSTFGIKRLHNKWSKDHLFVPLINFVENFDIKPWFERLSSIRDAKQRAEEAEQGGGFSLFDSGFKASSLETQAQNKLQSHIARFGGIDNANETQGGRTPLIASVDANDYDLALDLWRAGADINGVATEEVATGEHAGKAEAAQSLAEFLRSKKNEKQNILNHIIGLLGSPDARNYQMFVDMLLQSDLENDLLPYDHVKNDYRTLLMLLSEAGEISTANLKALVYFKEQADLKGKHIAVDGKDNHGRTALFYAAHYGLENIVDFLIDKLNAKVDIKDVNAANYKGYAGTTEEGCARIKSKLAAKLASQ